jgi:hypothetical protein
MKNINNKMEDLLSEFDYLFQEGVYFKKDEIERTKFLLNKFNEILNDSFLNIK